MMRRRRGPGLLMTAAVVGTASHVGAASAQKQAAAQQNAQATQQQLAQQQADIAALAAQQQAATVPAAPVAAPIAAPVAAADPLIAQIQNLASLHAAGILSDEEFAAAKAKVLGL